MSSFLSSPSQPLTPPLPFTPSPPLPSPRRHRACNCVSPSDDLVSTRESALRLDFAVLAFLLNQIAPLDSSAFSGAVSDRRLRDGQAPPPFQRWPHRLLPLFPPHRLDAIIVYVLFWVLLPRRARGGRGRFRWQ